MSDSLDEWEIFRPLDDELKQNIRLAIVFGENAIFVTREDEVFGFGKNEKGCLGTGTTFPLPEPKTITRLCGQQIEDLVYYEAGESCRIFAISASGSAYAWGANPLGQLGLKTTEDIMLPIKIKGVLDQKRIVQVACSELFTLALTSEGKVYACGKLDIGGACGNSNNISHAKLEAGDLNERFIISIACAGNFCLALLDSGEVFAWEYNYQFDASIQRSMMRQHLLEAIRKKKAPHKVGSLRGVAISKIVSSSNKILALSYDGDVHFWQRTDSDQPGSSFENGNLIFATISTAIGRVKDIAAVYHDDVQNFAAITETDDVYIWQQCNGETLSSPTLTSFSTLDQVFAQQARTFRPLKSEEEKVIPGKIIAKSSLNECAQQFMDDTETSDFAFVVEGKKIHVHKLILMMRCAVFKTMFQGDWKESNTSEQTVEGHSYVAFYAFMKYFYTDEIDLPPDSALELLALAHFYHLPALQEKCGKFIKRGVTVENAAAIFEKAIQYEAKELEEYVFKFCVDHMTGVISSDGFKTLKPDTLSELLRRAAQHGAFKN